MVLERYNIAKWSVTLHRKKERKGNKALEVNKKVFRINNLKIKKG